MFRRIVCIHFGTDGSCVDYTTMVLWKVYGSDLCVYFVNGQGFLSFSCTVNVENVRFHHICHEWELNLKK